MANIATLMRSLARGLERAAETRSLVVYLSSLSSLALALMHTGSGGASGAEQSRAAWSWPRRTATSPGGRAFLPHGVLGWLHMRSLRFRGRPAHRGKLAPRHYHAEEPAGPSPNHRAADHRLRGFGERPSGKCAAAFLECARPADALPQEFFPAMVLAHDFANSGWRVRTWETGKLDQASVAAKQILEVSAS